MVLEGTFVIDGAADILFGDAGYHEALRRVVVAGYIQTVFCKH